TSAVATYWRTSGEWGPALAGRMILMFLVMLPYASEAAVHREDVVRGLARAPAPPHRDERLAPLRVPAQHRVSAVVAGAVLASAVAVAHAVLQATRLFFSQPVRNVMATVVLGALWFLPLLGSWGSGLLDLPPYAVALPGMLCPFVALTKACVARQPAYISTSDVDPIGVALVAVLLNVLIACAIFGLLRELVGRLKD